MNTKNYNDDETRIDITNSSNEYHEEADNTPTPPPYQPISTPKSKSNSGMVAATAGLAFAAGVGIAYGLGAFDSDEIPNTEEPTTDDDLNINIDNDSINITGADTSNINIDTNGTNININNGSTDINVNGSTNINIDSIGTADINISNGSTDIHISQPDINIDFNSGAEINVKSLGSSITTPSSLEFIGITTVTTDDMSFSTAFATARRELGPHGVFEWRGGVYGTYYDNEWKHMPDSFKQEFSNHNWFVEIEEMGDGVTHLPQSSHSTNIDINTATNGITIEQHNTFIHNNIDTNIGTNVHDATSSSPTSSSNDPCAPLAYSVDDVMMSTSTNDDMSFAKAFATARAEVGPGGVFEWRGGVYNTFYESEWNRLSESSKETFGNHDWQSEFDKCNSIEVENGNTTASFIDLDAESGFVADTDINNTFAQQTNVIEQNVLVTNVNVVDNDIAIQNNQFIENEYITQEFNDNNIDIENQSSEFVESEYIAQEFNNIDIDNNVNIFDQTEYTAEEFNNTDIDNEVNNFAQTEYVAEEFNNTDIDNDVNNSVQTEYVAEEFNDDDIEILNADTFEGEEYLAEAFTDNNAAIIDGDGGDFDIYEVANDDTFNNDFDSSIDNDIDDFSDPMC